MEGVRDRMEVRVRWGEGSQRCAGRERGGRWEGQGREREAMRTCCEMGMEVERKVKRIGEGIGRDETAGQQRSGRKGFHSLH